MNIMAERETSYALSDLVKRRRADRRYSLRALAERCIDRDTGIQEIKHAWIERLEKREPVIPPQLPQLRALAAGLELPLRDIQDAAGEQFLGITTQQADGQIRVLMNRAGDLSPEDLARLVAIADTFPVKPGKTSGSSKKHEIFTSAGPLLVEVASSVHCLGGMKSGHRMSGIAHVRSNVCSDTVFQAPGQGEFDASSSRRDLPHSSTRDPAPGPARSGH